MIGLTKGHHSTSATLIVTFLLGIGIGFSLCYAGLSSLKVNFADSGAPPAARPPAEPSVPSPVEEIAVAQSPAATPAVAPVESPGPGAQESPPIEAPEVTQALSHWPGLHLILTLRGTELRPEESSALAAIRPGMVLLEAQNVVDEVQTRRLVRAIKEAAGMGTGLASFPLIGIAQDGGPLFNPLHLENAPSPAVLASDAGLAQVSETALRYAEAALNRDIAVLFGPSLDVYRPGVSDPLLEAQTFGTDPEVVTNVGITFAENLSDRGVIPIVKHFPGLGAAVPGVQGAPTIEFQDFNEIARLIFPFYEAAERNLPAILIGHVALPAMHQERPNLSAALSDKLIGEIIRKEWEYDGVLIADNMYDALQVRTGTVAGAVVEALAAGCDAVLLRDWKPADLTIIVDAIGTGYSVPAQQQDAAFRRFSAWQARLTATRQIPAAPPLGMRVVAHDVQSGENLVNIARAYQVSVSDLMQWNGLATNDIRDGRSLNIYVPEEVQNVIVAQATPPAPVPAEPEPSAPAEVTPEEAEPAETVPAPEPPEEPEAAAPAPESASPVEAEPVEAKSPPPAAIVSAPKAVPDEAPAPAPEPEPEPEPMPEPEASETEPAMTVEPPAAAPQEASKEDGPVDPATDPLSAPAEPEPAPDSSATPQSDTPPVLPEAAETETPEPLPASDDANPEPTEAEEEAPLVEETPLEPVTPEPVTPEPVTPEPTTPARKLEHLVVRGDTLSSIATQYGVSQADLRAWNSRESDTVKLDETLLVYLPIAVEDPDPEAETAPDAPVIEAADAEEPVTEAPPAPAAAFEWYTVTAGDNLGRIANRFGVSREAIMTLNNITDPNHVQLGQKIKIPQNQP